MAKKKGNRGKGGLKHGPPSGTASPVPKQKKPFISSSEPFDLEAINSAAVASVSQVVPIMIKQCRLCEAKDGPFLNIFDGEKIIAKKINQLLPLVIDEYDKLPHKICFRCSAKVEELHEFVQKCIRAQESLKKSLGESKAAIARKNWEEKLKENKMSNDDYCESLIKQAMEKIIGSSSQDEPMPIPVREPTPKPATPPPVPKKIPDPVTPPPMPKKNTRQPKTVEQIVVPPKPEETSPVDVKQPKILLDRVNEKEQRSIPARTTRSKPVELSEPKPEVILPQNETVEIESSPEGSALGENFLVGMVIKEKTKPVKTKKSKKEDVQVLPVEEPKPPEKIEKPKKKEKLNKKDYSVKEKLNGSAEKPIIVKAPPRPPLLVEERKEIEPEPEKSEEPEYDIMQHVTTIKVGGAGYLFQCKLCKRNFLKKEVVLGHHCAKAGALRQEMAKQLVLKPEPPKPIVKEVKPALIPRPVPKTSQSDKEIIEAFKIKTAQSLSINNFSMESSVTIKPKPGPASKKKVSSGNSSPVGSQHIQNTPSPAPPTAPVQSHPSIELPTNFPASKNRYKLCPGPNNTYTLVEDTTIGETTILKRKLNEEVPKTPELTPQMNRQGGKRNIKEKVLTKTVMNVADGQRMSQPSGSRSSQNHDFPSITPDNHNYRQNKERFLTKTVIDVDDDERMYQPSVSQLSQNHDFASITPDNHNFRQMQCFPPMPTPVQHAGQPYPVGLFQTIPSNNNPQFQTAGMKKQSYTVVQTGHPGKLLISTKNPPPPPPVPAVKAKKGKKAVEPPKQPYTVTSEDSTSRKEDGFFTFINVDPLLQPSYVLPTTSIIQESQITTSTPAGEKAAAKKVGDSELYSCELCNMEFSREKKLLAHLQTHYSKQDTEEEEVPVRYSKQEQEDDWARSAPKKKSRKS